MRPSTESTRVALVPAGSRCLTRCRLIRQTAKQHARGSHPFQNGWTRKRTQNTLEKYGGRHLACAPCQWVQAPWSIVLPRFQQESKSLLVSTAAKSTAFCFPLYATS
ncbi:hypothetical protein V5799_029223 [Amblyomma americanum]|uniref:Uncharacterized protein n=1 Tax=Amblyomma americanum TaxID=6943 RepID=A0AAQ4ERN0_AMBAM